MRPSSCAVSSSALPSRKRATSSTERRYSSCDTLYTQGAGQRLIWYCRHGRRRFDITESVQVRSWKCRLTIECVSRMEEELANGPEYRAPFLGVLRNTSSRRYDSVFENRSQMKFLS